MCSETKKKKEEGSCDPKEFQKMFEMMRKCCEGEKGTIDCSAMMEFMKKCGCCGPVSGETKSC